MLHGAKGKCSPPRAAHWMLEIWRHAEKLFRQQAPGVDAGHTTCPHTVPTPMKSPPPKMHLH